MAIHSKNGYYAQNGWLQDPATQKYYYFNMAAIMEADTTTPDGYYVGADGAWDGNASTKILLKKKSWTWRRQGLGASRYRLEVQTGRWNLPYQFLETGQQR